MIYIASPYSHPDEAVRQLRYERARAFTAHLMQRNFIAFSPIVYAHEMAKEHSLPTDFQYWKRFNDYMMRNSVAVCVLQLQGWDESRGVTYELDFAAQLNLSVFHYAENFALLNYEER